MVQAMKRRPSPLPRAGTAARSTHGLGSGSFPSAAWGGQKRPSTNQLQGTMQPMDAVSSVLRCWIKTILTLPFPEQHLLMAQPCQPPLTPAANCSQGLNLPGCGTAPNASVVRLQHSASCHTGTTRHSQFKVVGF